jgi:hypothetical protein
MQTFDLDDIKLLSRRRTLINSDDRTNKVKYLTSLLRNYKAYKASVSDRPIYAGGRSSSKPWP